MQGMKFVACWIENNSIQRIFRLTDRSAKGNLGIPASRTTKSMENSSAPRKPRHGRISEAIGRGSAVHDGFTTWEKPSCATGWNIGG